MPRLAYVLAKEVSYRSRRRWGKNTYIAREVKPSAFASNALQAFLLLFFSGFLALTILISPAEEVEAVYLAVSIAAIGFSGVFALLTTVSFTAAFTSERIIEAFRLLPISEDSLTKSYFEALLLYWGGLSNFTPLLPVLAVCAYRVVVGDLPVSAVLSFSLAFALSLLTIFFTGIALGTYAVLVKRSAVLRFFSTAGWLAVFLMWLLLQRVMDVEVLTHLFGGALSIVRWLALAPFLGILLLHRFPLASSVSLVFSVFLAFLAIRASFRRFRKVTSSIVTASYQPSVARLRVRSKALAYVVKDLRLLFREPRRLASVLYMLILPLTFLFNPSKGMEFFIAVFISCIVGVFASSAVTTVFYVEGEGAPLLYTLPLTRRWLAFVKIAAILPFSLIGGLAVYVTVYLSSGDFCLALYALVLELAVSLVSAFAFSLLVAMMLPDAPSQWSEASLSKLTISVSYILLTVFILGLSLLAAAMTSNFVLVILAATAPSLLTVLIALFKIDKKSV